MPRLENHTNTIDVWRNPDAQDHHSIPHPTMTIEEKNIAICKFRGLGYYFSSKAKPWKDAPDHFTDLNAMHEAEEHLSGLAWADYFDLLQRTGKATGVRATASQRAEAFGLTLGLWQQGQ